MLRFAEDVEPRNDENCRRSRLHQGGVTLAMTDLGNTETSAVVRTSADRLFQYGVPVALVLFALLTFWVSGLKQTVGTAILLTVGVYLTTIFLYAGIPLLAFRSQRTTLAAGIIAAVGLSVLWIGESSPWIWISTWLMLLGSTIAAGYLARAGHRFSKVYSTGLLIVLVTSLVRFLPLYPEVAEMARNSIDGIMGDVRMQLTVGGYAPALIDEYVGAFRTVLNTMIRLMPCGFVMGALMQYSLGYVWFSQRFVAPSGKPAVVPSFATWKAPFELAVVVLVASAMRIFGNDAVKLVADNLLVGLGVVYAIMGMVLIESFLRRVHIGWLGRAFVYIALFLAQIVGLLVVALLGFIDSYMDWRARAQRSVDETV